MHFLRDTLIPTEEMDIMQLNSIIILEIISQRPLPQLTQAILFLTSMAESWM